MGITTTAHLQKGHLQAGWLPDLTGCQLQGRSGVAAWQPVAELQQE